MKTLQLPKNIARQVKQALKEDIQTGDVTANLIPVENQAQANIICRDKAVICGISWVEEVFKQLDTNIKIVWIVREGEVVAKNTQLCKLIGNARNLLSGERVALNFLQTLSATATITRKYVQKIQTSCTKILDTRKTLPNLRLAQKYAVRCGGGKNHRIGLYDMVLIKENHIMAASSIAKAVNTARQLYPYLKIEVETENLTQFHEARKANADVIMLDNFSIAMLNEAVSINTELNKSAKKQILLEASGGINLNTVAMIAKTGVDYISVGEITKNINAVDLSMRFEHY